MLGKQKRALKGRSAGDFSTDFEFGERDGLYSEDWLMADVMAQLKKRVSDPHVSAGLWITILMYNNHLPSLRFPRKHPLLWTKRSRKCGKSAKLR